eukprot:11635873-Alexandrium_andersonii.AAC.1
MIPGLKIRIKEWKGSSGRDCRTSEGPVSSKKPASVSLQSDHGFGAASKGCTMCTRSRAF